MTQREDELNDALGLHQDPDRPDNVTALPGPRRLRALENDQTTPRTNHSAVGYNRNEDH